MHEKLYDIQSIVNSAEKDLEGLVLVCSLLEKHLKETERTEAGMVLRTVRGSLNVVMEKERRVFDEIDQYILEVLRKN